MGKKKLIIACLAITMVTFSSISIYANDNQGKFFIQNPATLSSNGIDNIAIENQEESNATKAEIEEQVHQREKEAAAAAKAAAVAAKKKAQEKYLNGLAHYICSVNNNISIETATKYITYFVSASKTYGIDEKLIMALAQKESTFRSTSSNSGGYKGMMQTSDGITKAAGYEVEDIFDPQVAIKVGARYLNYKMDEFGSKRLALTAYNQGSGSVNSGNYTTGFATVVLGYYNNIENYLENNGYTE